MTSLSVIILSKTISKKIFDTTIICIESLQASENFVNPEDLEIILIESNLDDNISFDYPSNVRVILPNQEFGFHKFLNIGIQAATKNFIALCNNDLVFHSNWFSEILTVSNQHQDILSFSPIDPNKEFNLYKKDFLLGYKVTKHIKGWCLVCKKDLFARIGLLDENFKFYYSDNDYSLTLLYNNIKHALVSKSKIEHLHKVNSKEANSKNDAFFKEVNTQVKIPKYLNHPNLKWILTDKRVLFDHLTFYNKWGKQDSLYRVIAYAEKLNELNLNFLVKIMFTVKRVLKL